MTEIRLKTWADALGGKVPTSATLTITYSSSRSSGADVTLPRAITVLLTNGVPVTPIVVDPTPDDGYATVQVTTGGNLKAITRTVAIPDVPTVDWADLVNVNPATFQPVPPVKAASDGLVAALVADPESLTRAQLDAIYSGGGDASDDAVAALVADPESLTAGALSEIYGSAATDRAAWGAGRRLRAITAGNRSVAAKGVTLGAVIPVSDTTAITAASLGAAVITAADDLVTMPTAHGLRVNDRVIFHGLTGAAGLTAGQGLYVFSVPSENTFKVSSAFSSTVRNITTDGTATAVYRREYAWNRDLGALNPAIQILGTRAVQASTTTPQYEYAAPDATIVTYAPGTQTGTFFTYSVRCDASGVDILLRNTGADKLLYIDGLYAARITNAALAAAGVASGTNGRLPIAFDSVAPRVITIFEMSSSGRAIGFDVPRGFRLLYPASTPKGPRVLFSGDSFTEGTGSTGGFPYITWVGWHLGWADVWKGGSGSTGYVADGDRLALIDRYQNDVIAQAPDIVIIPMGLNDRATYEAAPATVTAAAATIWDAIVAALPATELVIVGPWPNNGGIEPAASLYAMDNDFRAMARARGLRFISPLSAGLTFPLSEGPHPDAVGHEKLGYWLAGELSVPYIDPA